MKIQYYIALVVAAIIWGTGFIAVKILIDNGVQPFFIVATRFSIASAILVGILSKKLRHIHISTYKKGSVLGSFLFLGLALQTIGIQYTSVANNAFITAIYVVFVPFIYWVIYRTRPKIMHFIATIISLVGVRFLNEASIRGINIGDLLTLFCAFFFALHVIFLGIYTQKDDPVVLSFIQMAFSAILGWIFVIIFEPVSPINFTSILALIYLGVFGSLVAFTLQNIGQKYVPQITASLILCNEGVFATVFAIWLLGDVLTLNLIIGGILILIAIIFAELKLNSPQTKPQLPKVNLDE